MGQSSIHIQKASAGSVHHNSRENYSKSVVFTDEKNELWNDSKTAFTIYRDELKIRSEAYSNATGQKLQSRAVTHLSGVINLEQHHTLKDLEKIKNYLEKEFDTKVFQMAIHRDEGKIRSKTTGEYLVSGTDFFYNPDDNKHYFNKRTENKKHIFENELNINDYVIEKNYHAHIEMLGLKSDGKAIRQDMNRFKLSKLQDFVAESLQMQRGKNYLIDKSSKRLDTHEFKASKKLENEIEKETNKRLKNQKEKIQLQVNEYVSKTNITQKELKEEINKLRAELKENKATRADYAQLEELNKALKEEVKNKTLTIEQLQQQTSSLRTQLLKSEKEVNTLKTQINSLEEQNKTLESKVITLEEKISHSSNMNDYEQIKKENEELKKENKNLKEKIKSILAAANEKIKSLFHFKIWNNYKHKQTKFDLEYINENKVDYWEELAHYHPKIETLYNENIENELIKIPGEKDYSKMNLEDILNLNKEDLKEFKKEATKELKEMLEEENKETVVVTRKLF